MLGNGDAMGDRAGMFLDYLRPHWERLYSIARYYAVSEPEAHDLVQETLLRAYRNFSPGDDRTYQRAWIVTIMRNVAVEWQRTAGRRVRLMPVETAELTDLSSFDPAETFSSFPAMDEEAFREFLDDRIALALDSLPAVFREVLVLSVGGDLNYREISEVLDCPIGTIMSRMSRARRTLRSRLARVTGVLSVPREDAS